jgi:hypothetical protein
VRGTLRADELVIHYEQAVDAYIARYGVPLD